MEPMVSGSETAIVEWSGSSNSDAPLVVLMHGWGESERTMTLLVPSLPEGPAYASLRARYLGIVRC
jgi:phospholipase/carboxylesterase